MRIKSGVLLEYQNYEIEVSPYKSNSKKSFKPNNGVTGKKLTSEQDDFVLYTGAFGKGTSLRYTPLFDGYKEDIILDNSDVGNEFTFFVKAENLIAKLVNDYVSFIDPATDKEVAKFEPIYVYDSYDNGYEIPHETNDNHYELEEVTGGYLLTIVVDKNFLQNPETVYPVYVDPTTTFNQSSNISDTIIYSGRPNYTHSANQYLHVGYYDANYKVGRVLVKFPGLVNNVVFKGLQTEQIKSVVFRAYHLGGNSTTTIEARPFYSTWNESTATYNNVNWNNYGGVLSSKSVNSSQGYIDFNITSQVLEWWGESDGGNGIILKNTNESSASYDKAFASKEYGAQRDSTRMPLTILTYEIDTGFFGPFSSADEAARAFAIAVYSSSRYIRHEYSACIYARYGTYYFTVPRVGNPHSCLPQLVDGRQAYIHTHPNSNAFSSSDKSWAESHQIDAYVVCPNGQIRKYDYIDNTDQVIGSYTPHALTASEKSFLQSTYRQSWLNHLNSCTGFGCQNMTWPTPM